MHARIVTLPNATNVAGGLKFIREKALPVIREHKGYVFLSVSYDASASSLSVLSNWATEADMRANEPAMVDLRREGASAAGAGEVTVQSFEVVAAESSSDSVQEGSALRVVPFEFDPSRLDELTAIFTKTAGQMKSAPGFRSIRLMVDRAAGRGAVGSVWADETARKASEVTGEEARKSAVASGVKWGEVSNREIVLVDTTA